MRVIPPSASMAGPSRAAGFSLIEVLIAMVILSIGVLGVTGLQLMSKRNNQDSVQQIRAASLAQELVERMRADPALRSMPVLFVSTESSQKRIKLLLEKSSGFVHKPFNPEEVRELILRIIGAGDETRSESGAVQGGTADF